MLGDKVVLRGIRVRIEVTRGGGGSRLAGGGEESGLHSHRFARFSFVGQEKKACWRQCVIARGVSLCTCLWRKVQLGCSEHEGHHTMDNGRGNIP